MKHTITLETSESVLVIEGTIKPDEDLSIELVDEIGVSLTDDQFIRLTMGGILEVSLSKEETLILVEQLVKVVNQVKSPA